MPEDDNKNQGQWELVGGKAFGKPKGKTISSKTNGTNGPKSGAAHKPILKVDELGI